MSASSILILAHGQLGSLRRMDDIIPQADDRFVTAVMFERQYADAGGAAEEEPPSVWRQPEPASRDHADDVATGESQHVARDAAHAGNEAVGAGGDVLR